MLDVLYKCATERATIESEDAINVESEDPIDDADNDGEEDNNDALKVVDAADLIEELS